ncbi:MULTISPECIES: hypothetical protein [unclassified Pseudomonas]|uniref:hypothetical protein n=1 Tax=unclassified Pseudomonas TaxID=196821 RepID=UPI0026004FC6|nr:MULTISPECIES: hypothetical protein [unclassified Pseudomonas]
MTKKAGVSATDHPPLHLAEAIEEYVAQGGVINIVPEGETGDSSLEAQGKPLDSDADALMHAKLEQLKGLVAKGAGVSALQYSLRMNRKEIKRLANENGLKILYSRPVRGSRLPRGRDTPMIDDTVAGHAMHYSSLGYTVAEIAQLLDLSVREVWNIGKAYRFEFKNEPMVDSSTYPFTDGPGT